jgi:hypothetical protein
MVDMTVPHDDEQDKPLDPAVENVRRKLVRFIVINLGILFIALMAVVVALVYRATRVSETAPATISELPMPAGEGVISGTLSLPSGARVLGHAIEGSQLSLRVELASGAEAILLYDIASGRSIGQIDISGGR